MLNPFVLRKYATLIFSPLITTVCFYIGLVFYGFIYAFIFMFVGILLSAFMGVFLLKNPFSMMLEGKGILLLNLDSTGVIRPIIVNVMSPYIRGRLNNTPIKDVFDREAVLNLAAPVKSNIPAKKTENGGIEIKLDEETYNRGRFALFHYPVLLYNDQIKSVLTKDFLAEGEKHAFAEHSILFLNRSMEDLTSHVRDFGRYIVDLAKPQQSIFKNKWVIIIIVVLVIILAALFAGPIIETLSKTMGPAAQALTGATGATDGSAVTIRG